MTPVDAQQAALQKIRGPTSNPSGLVGTALESDAPATAINGDSDMRAPFKLRNAVSDSRVAGRFPKRMTSLLQ